jgi:hypothetical protein
MIVALTGLSPTTPSARILSVLQDAEVHPLASLAALFGVVPGTDVDVYELAIAAAISEVFEAVRASTVSPALALRPSADFDLRAVGRSLRDDAAADDVLRAVVALNASVRADLRLTVKALVRKGLMAALPIPLETLPPRSLALLHSHLLLQEAVFAIVKKSVGEGGDASRASTSAIISRRLADLDAFASCAT